MVDSPHEASMSIKLLDLCHKLGQEKAQPRVTPLLLGYLFPSRDPFNKQQKITHIFSHPWLVTWQRHFNSILLLQLYFFSYLKKIFCFSKFFKFLFFVF